MTADNVCATLVILLVAPVVVSILVLGAALIDLEPTSPNNDAADEPIRLKDGWWLPKAKGPRPRPMPPAPPPPIKGYRCRSLGKKNSRKQGG